MGCRTEEVKGALAVAVIASELYELKRLSSEALNHLGLDVIQKYRINCIADKANHCLITHDVISYFSIF
ncbi:hypothetical protein D3C81_2154570 [compost metagenome]